VEQKLQWKFATFLFPLQASGIVPSNGSEKLLYRVCQELWPSLTFADENIELRNFWASCKSQVARAYLCIHFCSNYIGWSNQGKYYEIEIHYAKQNVAT
jgi:hypothetical protein